MINQLQTIRESQTKGQAGVTYLSALFLLLPGLRAERLGIMLVSVVGQQILMQNDGGYPFNLTLKRRQRRGKDMKKDTASSNGGCMWQAERAQRVIRADKRTYFIGARKSKKILSNNTQPYYSRPKIFLFNNSPKQSQTPFPFLFSFFPYPIIQSSSNRAIFPDPNPQSSAPIKIHCHYTPNYIQMWAKTLTRRALATFSSEASSNKVSLPELKYAYSALEPVISSKLLQTHHKKHHQTYVNNLNAAFDQFQEAKTNFDYNRIAALCQTIKFNLGGHINHSIYWENLAPIGQGGGEYPAEDSPFTQQVVKQFGSYENLIDEFTKKTIPVQGSGWGWLAYDNASKCIRILQLANQEMLAPAGLTPLLTIDVWQHAYYIDYKNVRLDYVKQIWKIVNWKDAEARFLAATAPKK